MSVGFYMDVHIHRAVTDALRLRGVDVLTAQEDSCDELDDAALLDRSTSLSRVLFTQDRDLLREATHRQRAGERFGGVVYAHQVGVTIGKCVHDLQLIAEASDPAEWFNKLDYLPL